MTAQFRLTLASLAVLAVIPVLAEVCRGGEPIVRTYAAPDGVLIGSASLLLPEQDRFRDKVHHVVLLDTSASQVGEHREASLKALHSYLRALPEDDQVSVLAYDVQLVPLTKGFCRPQAAAAAALASVKTRFPAGTSDLVSALQAALDQLTPHSSGAVLIIGDGMSIGHLIGPEEVHRLTAAFRTSRIPIHSFAVGPERDLRLLGMLAAETGGVVKCDDWGEKSLTPEQAGLALANAARCQVFYPESVAVEPVGVEVRPSRPLPMRTDRKTVYLLRGPIDRPGVSIRVTGDFGGSRQEFEWELSQSRRSTGNTFLAKLWADAGEIQGSTVGLAGDWMVNYVHQAFEDYVSQLTAEGQLALQNGLRKQAELIGLQLRQLDPLNAQAERLINPPAQHAQQLIEHEKPQTDGAQPAGEKSRPSTSQVHPSNPRAWLYAQEINQALERLAQADPQADRGRLPEVSGGPMRVQFAQAQARGEPESGAAGDSAPKPATSSTPAPLIEREQQPAAGNIQQYEALREARGQKLAQQVEQQIGAAYHLLDDGQGRPAEELLNRTRGTVKSATDVPPELRNNLLRRLNTMLQDVRARTAESEAVMQERQRRQAEQEVSARLIDFASERDLQLTQMVDRIRALMADAYHGDPEAFEQAETVAREVLSEHPGSALGVAEVFTTEAAGHLDKAFRLRATRSDRLLATLYEVEKAHVPFPADPPVVYPPADVWWALTEMRKKWKSVDLHSNSKNEEKIYAALDSVTSVEFPANPLSDVIDFLATQHGIPIRLDKPALEAEGLTGDEEISLVLSGIKLRSALKLLLENVAGTPLTYVIEDEIMKVTTQTKADEKLQLRVYPVADLVIPPRPLRMGGMGGMGGGMMGGGMGGMGGGMMGGGMGGMGGGMGGMGGMGGGFFSLPPHPPSARTVAE